MGQHPNKELPLNTNIPQKISRNNFEFRYVIGKGGFGKVWKVILKKTQKVYALKEMSKVKIIDKKCENSVKTERELLSQLHHPFIVNMLYAFQDFDTLYLVMDLLTGGDLRYHLCTYDKFPYETSKFFIACLILGLEYIHQNKIIHRDLKPENLVCDLNGYVRITDFGVAKKYRKDNAQDTSGTPGYMSPEVLMAQNHSYTADFFAIGVMLFEFMFGERPYNGRNRKEIREDVLKKQVYIKKENLPSGWKSDCVEFCNLLLMRKPYKRLGYNGGIIELKNNNFFKGFNWELLESKKMESPFIPSSSSNFDKSFCEHDDPIYDETIERYQEYVCRKSYENLFNGYTYMNDEENSRKIKNIKIVDESDKSDKKIKLKIKNIIDLKNPLILSPKIVNFNNFENTNINSQRGNPYLKSPYFQNKKITRNFSNINLNGNDYSYFPKNNDFNTINNKKILIKSSSLQQLIPNYNYGNLLKLEKKPIVKRKQISNLDEYQISNFLSDNKRQNLIAKNSRLFSPVKRSLINSNSDQNMTCKLPKIQNMSIDVHDNRGKLRIKKIKKKNVIPLSVNNSNQRFYDHNGLIMKKSESFNLFNESKK